MKAILLLGFVALQAAFIWARYAVFRIDGPTPRGVRLIEASATVAIVAGVVLIWIDGTTAVRVALAAVAMASSAGIFAWAVKSIGPGELTAAFSPDVPVHLQCRGAYAFVRNPFYLSYILAHAAPLIVTGSPWALVSAVWMTGVYLRATVVEERKFLSSALADEFRRYAARTGRFLPRLTSLFGVLS